jgi:coenzyme F420-reducing hydrogenase gamma subunit
MKAKKRRKPKAAVFTLTSCFGCSFEFMNLKENLLRTFDYLDFVNFRLVKGKNLETHYDIVFVEGGVTTKREIKEIKELRKHAKFLVALGACACNGCVMTVKNYRHGAEKQTYGGNKFGSVGVKGIGEHVKVDYYLRGCPFFRHELMELVKSWLNDKVPKEKDYDVCVECRKNQVPCLLDKGIVCLGPISRAGCKAICPEYNYQCVGCRGLAPDKNLEEFLNMLRKKFKLSKNEIKKKFEIYNLYEDVRETEEWQKLKK